MSNVPQANCKCRGSCHAALWLTLAPYRIHHEGQQHGDIGVDVVLIQVEQVHHCRHQLNSVHTGRTDTLLQAPIEGVQVQLVAQQPHCGGALAWLRGRRHHPVQL